jgi:hypothetical protein
MNTITIPVVVGEDRRLVIDLPADIPTGPAELEVIVHSHEDKVTKTKNSAREEARAKLQAAGRLSIELNVSDDVEPLSEEELERLGRLPPGSPTAQEIIDEERGDY